MLGKTLNSFKNLKLILILLFGGKDGYEKE
jgi:hypothetical protein